MAGTVFPFEAKFGYSVEPVPATAPESFDLAGISVLIVDDNRINRHILSATCIGLKMGAHAMDSGPSALEHLFRHAESGIIPDLSILDFQMPDLDGFEMAQKLRALRAFDKLRIIMFTSAGEMGDAAKCQDIGIESYLVKPVRQAELKQAMIAVLCNSILPAPDLSQESILIPAVLNARRSLII